ncbi:MAG: ABC transporter-related protein [Candidatus Peregrinibacteria bacterium GW2011_GWA2_33_10]|nr:MAG: ABC transporter-related protein [Candidatus Peregrinibacteria bacterium GW2011_GWA2_33_10]KKP40767.1 MAG: ABC transporter ATP-binding protein [Candidatus Peregrinibacteria bacterium GW2011_GWC2_33_13]
MLEIRNLSKSYIYNKQKFFALKNINLDIKEGEIIAVFGASGSGKTTLLNLIAGFEKPTSGKIISFQNSGIGFIFQDFLLLPFLTLEENIFLPLKFNKIKDPYFQIIDETGLNHRRNHKPAFTSGGEKQRAAICRALITRPKLLLADEPTGNLDEKTAKSIIQLLQKLHKEKNFTMIIATHDQKIAKIADKIINLKNQ